MSPSLAAAVAAVLGHAAHETHGPPATTMAAVAAGGLAVAAVAVQLRHSGAVSRRAGRAGLALGLVVALLAASVAIRSALAA